jgi:hypothetical protein
VWRGGDRDADTGAGGGDRLIDLLNERDERLCHWLQCVLQRDGVIDAALEKRLREAGVDLDALRKCVAKHCKPGGPSRPQRDG